MQPLAAMTWEEVRDAAGARSVAILPVGAVEAHGPHLPLDTDVIIAQAMARAGAARLASRGLTAAILPPLTYTAAGFAEGFAGTLSLRPETVTATLLDIADSLARHGFTLLAIANAHLDPDHLASLEAAVGRIRGGLGLRVAFPNIATRPWALRLGDEFRSGACHAGRFETSIVLAERPEQVRAVPVDAGLRMDTRELHNAIIEDRQAGRKPFCVVASAGTNSPAAGCSTRGSKTCRATRSTSEKVVMFGSSVSNRLVSA